MRVRVILLDNVRKLGTLGQIVDVNAGYARNFLIPNGVASIANAENEIKFEEKRAELERKSHDMLVVAKSQAKELEDLTITMSANATDNGKLYGSIGSAEVVAEVKKLTSIDLLPSVVVFPNGPIRVIGETEVMLLLHHDVTVKIKIVIEKG